MGAGGVREAGEERAGSGSSKRAGSGREMRNANFFSKTRTQNIFDLHLTSSESLLRLLNKRENENLRLG